MRLLTNLYFHQQKAVDKLIGLKIGALYMEMGTGKTRVALDIIQRRLNAGRLDKVLWLCPCSVQEDLQQNIKEHAEDTEFIRIAGIESLSQSARLFADLFHWISDRTMLIVDESNLVKNPLAIRSKRIVAIAGLCKYRMILNGTPVSRNEADMFNQWYLMDWRILGYRSYWSFAANHLEYDKKFRKKIRRVLNVDYLTDKISPYSYMIKKEECLTLPHKSVGSWEFDMTPEQREEYCRVRDAYLELLLEDEERIGSAAIYRTFTALQQVTSGRRIVSDPKDPIKHTAFFTNPMDNPRISGLLELIERLDGQIIIWCRFQHEIDTILSLLSSRYGQDQAVQFSGSLSQRQRQKSLSLFHSGARFFVANKACAGYGLNLQYCHQMIYYNNDWDWATRAQSEDRVHRIGQEHRVVIRDIYALDSIDQRILSCLARKENMADNFRDAIKSKNAAGWLDTWDLEDKDHDQNRVSDQRKRGCHKQLSS